jgi:signal transduction histidine kinase
MLSETVSSIQDFIFHSTADGIIVTDAAQHIRQINPAAAAMLGVTVEDVLNKTPEACFRHNAALINLFNRPGDQILDVRLPKRRLAVGIATTLVDRSRIVLLQDVTEQRDLDSRREALINSVAHDLRNPISALEGFAELVSKFGDVNEQQRRFLTRIQQTTNKLYDVVGSLVDLAWIEAGMPLEHVPIHLNRIIDDVVYDLSSLAHQRQMTIAISVQNPMPVVVGDPARIQMAIYNIMHNAITYSFPEQTVAIHAWSDHQEAYTSVADQGMGISDDELELIFDRLYRSRDDRVRNIPGGGLGLTMTRTIIRRHGGDIWASSNLGEGSTFTFVLPTTSADRAVRPAHSRHA